MKGSTNNQTVDTGGTKPVTLSIHHLPKDVLWKTFLLNANMEQDLELDEEHGFDHRSVNVTRFSSQVCHSWRELIVGSSSLWGRLIDLDCFLCARGEWRDEIMHRSGASALSIKGGVEGEDPESRRFFLSLIDHQWYRIERLNIVITDAHKFPPENWDLLRRPSKTIEQFHFSVDISSLIISTADDARPLFSDQAPRLRDYHSSSVSFNQCAPWLSNIRHLSVRSYALTISEWLDVLRQTHFLESLSLSYPFCLTDRTTSHTAVYLPQLQEIRISDSLFRCAIFLEHLIPKVGCSLDWYTGDYDVPSHPMELEVSRQVISKYSQGWFNSQTVQGLCFSVMYKAFSVCQYPYHSRVRPPFFSVDIYCATAQQLTIILPLLDSFALCRLENVTTLDVRSNLFSDQTFDSNICKFLMLLPAVDTIITSADGLEGLLSLRDFVAISDNKSSNSSQPVFPLLRVVKLNDVILTDSPRFTTGPFLPFFAWREEIHHPVQVLDVTAAKKLVAVDFLEIFSGLKVVWTDKDLGGLREYTCGSGNPDSLRLGPAVNTLYGLP